MPAPQMPLEARVYHAVMTWFVQKGRGPHYIELGRALGLGPEEARQALHHCVARTRANWLVPDTDYIASFAPFSAVPTQYLVSVDGQQRWYGQ